MVRIYLDENELQDIQEQANEAGMTIQAYIKSQLTFRKKSPLKVQYEETVTRAIAIGVGKEFHITSLYTKIEWDDLRKKLNAGQLGKLFREGVKHNEVGGVDFVGM
ncbi:MAG: single-stranded DNA-binding protein, partial [Peptococcaceae bacterium]|nr:single-stranded DNA-binding protein [Peptococcaceae bacterium]